MEPNAQMICDTSARYNGKKVSCDFAGQNSVSRFRVVYFYGSRLECDGQRIRLFDNALVPDMFD